MTPSGPARQHPLRIGYPELPIRDHRDELVAAIKSHPVVIVCGDTGSGKTTQLPKLCLEAGRGQQGVIGHTQPRRLAVRTVAQRIADELGVPLGGEVGYKIRFADETDVRTRVKLMTDGILLAEVTNDPLLKAYDTLIIDEAHERSLNVDFLLGYLHRILPERPDLRVIITSATLESARFARHFAKAPVVTIEGRSFPVQIEYLPPQANEDLADHVGRAVKHLTALDLRALGGGSMRDILVFLPGERQIREVERVLAGQRAGFDVLPLFSRLPAAQQLAIFQPAGRPRIVLATNIAETSLTVPRIRFVIDSGLARISRYSPRSRFQGLPVEIIAQANAAQRAGRCGRLAPGVCLRLYDREDFKARPAYPEPEILRTNLASVILQLEAQGLGHVDEFPFLDAPPAAAVRDGYRLLSLLGALDSEQVLTAIGRTMARLPLEPRLARVLLAARDFAVLSEALVVVSALSVADPRERPADARDKADQQHAQWWASKSDFVSVLNLWRDFRGNARQLSRAAFQRWCRKNFLSAGRLREWEDVHAQLRAMARDLRLGPLHAFKGDYGALHRALLTGFVDHIAVRDEGKRYLGAHQTECWLFPGSALQNYTPRWVMAAGRIATSRPYLHRVARISPYWVVAAAPHLITKRYLEPVWDAQRGRVLARELKSLFGLTLGAGRRVNYATVDPRAARELFIHDALVRDNLGGSAAFLKHNRALRQQVLDLEARIRSRRLLVGDRGLEQFYDQRLPAWVCDRSSLLRWLKKNGRRGHRKLSMTLEDLSTGPVAGIDQDYPLALPVGEQLLALRYVFDPTRIDDGITVRVPKPMLPAIQSADIDWLVPGWLPDKLTALIKALPKPLRRQLVPVPDTVAALSVALSAQRQQTLSAALSGLLASSRGVVIDAHQLSALPLPDYLKMNLEVVAETGAVIARGRDLTKLKQQLHIPLNELAPAVSASRWERTNLTGWDFRDLPERVTESSHGTELKMYPVLIDVDRKAGLTLLAPGPAATAHHRAGVRRLLVKSMPQQCVLIRDQLRVDRALQLSYFGIGTEADLLDDLLCAAAEEVFALADGGPVRTLTVFQSRLSMGRADFVPAAERLIDLVRPILKLQRRVRDQLASSPAVSESARSDITQQLNGLVYPGFLTATPPSWRAHLSRYLKAILQRLDQLAAGHPKDAAHQTFIERAAAPMARWRAGWPADRPWPPAIVEYRWCLEEFRVSLFAQSLGTALRVSGKRLEERWAEAVTQAVS